MGLVYNATEGKEQYLIFLDGEGGGGGGSAKQVTLLSITTAPTGTFEKGSKYYDSTDKKIYTAVADDTWTGATESNAEFGTIYIYDNDGTTEYYIWDGDNLVETDLEKYQLKSNITDSFSSSSQVTYPSSKALKDGLETAKPNLFDIKLLSQAIADKGFACMSHTTRQDISKEDVPTLYNDILEKYNNVDKAELPWTDGVSDPLSYYNWGIDYHDGYVYYINAAYNRIYRSSNITNINFTQFAQLSGGTDIFPFRCLSKYIVTGHSNGTEVRIINYTDGSTLYIPFNVGGNIVFKEYGDYVYIIGNSNNKIYRIPNVDFSELTTSSIEEVVDCSTYNQGTITDIHYDSNNSMWYVATYISQSNVAVHKTTDLGDLTKYTFGIWESNQWLEKGNYPRIFQYESRIVVILNGSFNGGWRRIYYTDDNFATVTMIQLSSGFINNNNYDNAYWSQYGNIIYSTGSYSQRYPGGDFNVTCPALETFDITRLIGDSTTFGYSLPYNSAGSGATRFVIDNDNRIIVGWLSKIHYSGLAPITYTDTYQINGSSVAINYYKYDDWKICIPDVSNDTNLDTVYNFLGYLNYWRLDTTVGAEKVSIPRDKKLWSMMFVGDNYQDDNLPSGEYSAVALKSELPKNLSFTNVSASNWVADNTYADYGYKCELSCSGVTANMFAMVIFAPTEADSGNYATVCNTGTNTVTIYSKVNTTITIPTIVAMEG